ncbi:MAG: hypothetical protein Q9205_007477 [Flavoplaca limonia]
MPCFNDLPNELLAIILDHVDIPDFENFAQINRHVKLFAQLQLERHRLLCRQYATTKIRPCNHESMYELLQTFMTTDHGQYIRTITFDRSTAYVREFPPGTFSWLVQEVSNRKIFTEALAQSVGADLMEKVWNHRRDILSALLLLCTPNVTHMSFPNDFFDSWWPDPIWLQAVLCPKARGDPQRGLQKLASVHMSGSSVNYYRSRDLILSTPSLRKLRLDSLHSWFPQGQAYALCPITTFKLIPNDSDPFRSVDSRALQAFLTETKQLTDLTIESKVLEHVTAPRLLTFAELLSPVTSTLRNLIVLDPRGEHNNSVVHWLGSFVEFIALEYFEAHFDGIYPKYLPPSLQRTKLHGKACCVYGKTEGKKRYSARVFVEAVLEGHKSGANPSLKYLEFTQGLSPRDKRAHKILEEAMRQCAPLGIQLQAPDVIDNAIVPVKSAAP